MLICLCSWNYFQSELNDIIIPTFYLSESSEDVVNKYIYKLQLKGHSIAQVCQWYPRNSWSIMQFLFGISPSQQTFCLCLHSHTSMLQVLKKSTKAIESIYACVIAINHRLINDSVQIGLFRNRSHKSELFSSSLFLFPSPLPLSTYLQMSVV